MKSLIIDTSGERLLFALSSHGHLTHESSFPSLQASSLCATSLQSFLQESSVTLAHLDFICAGTGPGSFLGTRIGVTLAQTLSYALDIPLIGFCSLQVCSPPNPSSFCVVIDAKSQGFYTLKGTKNQEKVYYATEPALCSEKELLSLHHTEKLQLITPMKDALLKKSPSLSNIVLDIPPSLSHPCSSCYHLISTTKQSKKPLAIHYLRLC